MYFRSLQVLRGWAALAVALYHLGYYAESIGRNPHTLFSHFGPQFAYGAWFFFVLSGFLMSYLIDTGYRLFLPRRLLRIYPTFWLVVIAVIFAKVLIFGSIDTPGLWKAMLLFPFGAAVAYPLGVEWTLVYEVFFYCVCAPFANRRLRHAFKYALLAWLAILAVAHLVFGVERAWFTGNDIFLPAAPHLPFSMMNTLFIAGGLSYYVYRRLPRVRRTHVVMLILAPVAFVLTDSHLLRETFRLPAAYAAYADHTILRLPLLAFCFSLIVMAVCLREERRQQPRREGVLERLGDHSYALYLIHVPVITVILFVAQWKLERPVGNWLCTAALIVALLAGWYVGRIDVWLHNRFKHRLGFATRFDTAVELPSPAAARVLGVS